MQEGKAMYRIGYPFWRTLGKAGIPLKLRIDVQHDNEAGVFIATSRDLRGLVCEAATMDELVEEVQSATAELLSLQLKNETPSRPITDLRICAA